MEDENPDTSLEIFLNLIHTLLDKYIPLIKITTRKEQLHEEFKVLRNTVTNSLR